MYNILKLFRLFPIGYNLMFFFANFIIWTYFAQK